MWNKINLSSYIWIIGMLVLLFFTYIKFDPTAFFRILIPILFASSFVLLGVFALTEIRKSIKERYSTETKNILRDIDGLREKQKHEDLEKQIEIDQEILSLRESLKGLKRNYFERCIVYSTILFAIAILSTFVDFGSYIKISNLIVMVFFSFWGLFYFSKMIQSIFMALNIIK